MRRLSTTILAPCLLAAVLAPSLSTALGITIADVRSTGASTTELVAGDRITIDLVLANEDRTEIFGLGIAAWGQDANQNGLADDGLRYLGGEAADSFFDTVALPGGSAGGIDVPSFFPTEVVGVQGGSDPEPGRDLGRFVRAISGISLTGIDGDGSLDLGVDGGRIADGDVHVRLVFEATQVASTSELVLHFGVGDPEVTGEVPTYGEVVVGPGGQRLPFENDRLALRVLPSTSAPIPEPGAALLFSIAIGVVAIRPPRVRRL